MKLIKNKNLENLAQVFSLAGIELFAVRGFVRGKLQGLSDQECGDIDLCWKATISEIEGLAKENGFDVKILNASLGVCCINYNGEVFEHATFRTEVCDKNGKHNPKSVSFVESVEADAKRRDFTINAIYYNISKEIIFDPFGGVSDLDKFKLKTIGDPDLRLKEDALRMLRAVRIACSYAFDLSEEAINTTKKWAEELNLNVDYKIGDMLNLPYEDNSFDCMLCRNVISHTDTKGVEKIIKEINRVLREDGECYLTLGSKSSPAFNNKDFPVVDENTKIRIEDGPENGIPHFYADYNLIQELI